MQQLLVLTLFLLATACAPEPAKQYPVLQNRQHRLTRPIIQKVCVDMPSKEASRPDADKHYWNKALDKAMDSIGRAFINTTPLVSGITSSEPQQKPVANFTTSGHVATTRHPQIDGFRQRAAFQAIFVPEKNMAGEVVYLENGKSMASMKDTMVVRPFSPRPVSIPSCFLIAENVDAICPHCLKIIGWGKVTQNINEPSAPETLCLTEIEESIKEIKPGDTIFFLKISGTILPSQTTGQPMITD